MIEYINLSGCLFLLDHYTGEGGGGFGFPASTVLAAITPIANNVGSNILLNLFIIFPCVEYMTKLPYIFFSNLLTQNFAEIAR